MGRDAEAKVEVGGAGLQIAVDLRKPTRPCGSGGSRETGNGRGDVVEVAETLCAGDSKKVCFIVGVEVDDSGSFGCGVTEC